MLSVGIITAPRTPMYIGNSLTSYFEQSVIRPFVFAEPSTPSFLNEYRVDRHDNPEQLGCVKNWFNAAKSLLRNCDDPFIMICEDDILWRDGAFDSLMNLLKCLTGEIPVRWPLPSDIGFVSLYRAAPYADKASGWQPVKLRSCGWLGALCTVFHRSMLEQYVANEAQFYESSRGIHLDYAIGAIASSMGKTILAHSPSFIQHLGDVSTSASNNVSYNRLSRFREAAL